MPAFARRRTQCCSQLPWDVANDAIVAMQSIVPMLGGVKSRVKEIAINLQRYEVQADEEDVEEPEPERDGARVSAPRIRTLLHEAGVPRSLSTKAEELVVAASMGHVLFPSLGNLISGYEMGTMSLAIMQLTDPHLAGAGWAALSPWDVGIIMSAKFYGAFGGSLVAFDQCSDLSARDILIWSSCGLAVCSVASAIAPSARYLILARIVSGFLEGVSSPARIAYTTETSDASTRYAALAVRTGTFGAGTVVGALFGAALLHVPGGWHIMLGATTLPAIAMSVGMCSLPHSPRWLLCRPDHSPAAVRRSDAYLALRELRCATYRGEVSQAKLDSEIQAELDAMCAAVLAETLEEKEGTLASFDSFIRSPATWTTFWVIFFKQTSGTVAIFSYKASVLTALGFGNHVGALTLLMMAVKSAATPCGAVLAGYLGSRGSLLAGSLGASLSMVGMCVCQASSTLSPLAFSCLVVNSIAFEISYGTVSHQLAAELYPQQHRQRGLAWTHICNYPLKVVCLQTFPWVLSLAGPVPIWTALAIMNTAGFLTMSRLVPETCGRTLEDISMSGHDFPKEVDTQKCDQKR